MRYLATIIGAAIGVLVFHSFLMLLVGAAAGYALDSHRHQEQRRRRVEGGGFVEPLFGLLGAVAKSDGRVSEGEIAVAERVMRQLQLDAATRQQAMAAFNRGKQADFRLDDAVARLRAWAHGHADLSHSVLDVLVDTVLAEGMPSEAKLQFLQRIAAGLGISRLQLLAVLAMKGAAHIPPGARPGGQGTHGGARARPSGPDPYAVLGLSRDADNATVKRTYRKLMSQHHPDRLGNLPEDLRRRAVERASAINAAYDRIKAQRGM